MKVVLLMACCLGCLLTFSQQRFKSDSALFIIVDPYFKGTINLYNKPGGSLIKKLRQNLKDEDFLFLKLKDKNDSMFYVSAEYGIKGYIADGWINKNKVIGVYVRNYGGQKLNLYKSPNQASKIVSTIPKYSNKIFQVIDYFGRWLKVNVSLDGKLYQGWLNPEMQCANPYTTCN